MFGRRKDDEDPFAALKDGGTYQSAPTTVPVEPPLSASPEHRPARPVRFSSSRVGFGAGGAAIWRLIALAVVSLIIGSVVLSVSSSVRSIKIPSFTFNTGSASPTAPGPPVPATPPPRPVDYATARGLRAGLARVERLARRARLTLLRVDVRTLSVYATRPNRHTSLIYLSPSITSVTPAAAPGERALPAGAIHPQVLASLIAQLHRRFGVSPGRIDYIVVSSPSGQSPQWLLFAKTAAHRGYAAPLNGGALTAI